MTTDTSANASLKHYDRSKVVQIVNSVIAKMEGMSGQSLRGLLTELQDLAAAIERTRAELAAAQTDQIGGKDVPTATDELDAVIDATQGATNDIMSSCEAMEKIVLGRGDDIETNVIGQVTKIYEACSFQDITGQRIRKVVSVLRQVESKVNHLLVALGHPAGDAAKHLVMKMPEPAKPENSIVNGPQLPGAGISQDEIDKLLESF